MTNNFWIFIFLITFSFADVLETNVSPEKPKIEELLKHKSLKRLLEDKDISVNSEWVDEENGFKFITAMLVGTSYTFTRKTLSDYPVYSKMSSSIKKFEYDEKKKTIEMIAEAGGYRAHSYIKVNDKYFDEIHYEVIQGDMKGFKITTRLWKKESKTIIAMSGKLPNAKALFPAALRLIAVPLSEMLLGIASGNFRSYIEDEYQKQKRK